MHFRSIKSIGAVVAGLLLCGSVHAAPITWNNVQNISGPGSTTITTNKTDGGPGATSTTITNGTNDVNTQGTLVLGMNYSGSPGDTFPYSVTINGQFFESLNHTPSPFAVTYSTTGMNGTYAHFLTPSNAPGTAGQSYGQADSGGQGPNPDYTMANGSFSFSPSATISFGNLIRGDKYLLQFWVSDPRTGNPASLTRVESLSSSTGGDINAPILAYEAPGGVDGQWVIGTFIADTSLSETLNLAASNTNPSLGDGGSAQVNLLQLRDITNTPEPTSLSAIGLGALALLGRRRRA